MGIAWLATFDPELDSFVRAIWSALEAEGIGRTPGQLGEKPHVSLFIGRDADAEAVKSIFEERSAPLMPALLEAAGVFLGPAPVLYLPIAPTAEFLRYHRALHDQLEAASVFRDSHYLPDSCFFHCTLAVDLRREDLPRALAAIGAYDKPLSGRIEGMQLIRYFPMETIGNKYIVN